jgi:hypothetical protein
MDERISQLDSFLRPGFASDDVPRLQTLLGARNLIDTFIGIFRGSTEEVIIRILVLTTLASRGEAPRWTPAELDAALGFIEPVALETARTRLSKYGLIVYDSADGTYAVGDHAFIVLAAWASAMQFADARFGEFGFMNAQIVGGAETLGVHEDLLRFALARTNTLHHELERAIVTGSATAIQEARTKINDVFTWGEQGVEILEKIAPDPDIGAERRVAARQLADSQSRMLGLAPRLDRTLHALETQRVRLGDSGLDSTDLKTWLRLCSSDTLISLIEFAGIPMPGPVFILGDIAIDVAEELINSDRPQDVSLPKAVDVVETLPPEITFDKESLDRLFSILDGIDRPLPLTSIVENKTFAEASYHLSLLPLLGGRGEISNHDPAARLATYSLELHLEQGLTDVSTGEVASVSSGQLRPKDS